jgi:phosphoglycerate dehydrogenase-like enzyme
MSRPSAPELPGQPGFRIFFNNRLSQDAVEVLSTGIGSHDTITAPADTVSVLGVSSSSLEGFDIAFGQLDPDRVLESTTLRWVHVSSAGYTRFDTPAFRTAVKEKGILISNSSSVYAEPCAEQLLAFILAGSRQLPQSLNAICENGSPEWDRLRSECIPLRGQKAVMLGYGAIARRLEELLRPFGMAVSAFRKTPRGDETLPIVTQHDLNTALSQADHVINILPDNAETRLFFNQARFAALKPEARFYNMGRGTTVDQNALLQFLQERPHAMAWLDVTDPEPLPEDHPLRHLGNCFITPHIGGGHQGESVSLVRHFLANLQRFRNGEALMDRVI